MNYPILVTDFHPDLTSKYPYDFNSHDRLSQLISLDAVRYPCLERYMETSDLDLSYFYQFKNNTMLFIFIVLLCYQRVPNPANTSWLPYFCSECYQ